MANFDLIEYQRRVIRDLMAENKALKDEVQAVKSACVKIQYHNEELTVQEVCERLEMAESALKNGRDGGQMQGSVTDIPVGRKWDEGRKV